MRFFEEVVFCFLTGNNDMHLKNFSLLRESDGAWNLSPAYDLVPVQVLLPSDPEELALTLNGRKRRLGSADFVAFGESLRLAPAQCSHVIGHLREHLQDHLDETLAASFLSKDFQAKVRKLIAERMRVACGV